MAATCLSPTQRSPDYARRANISIVNRSGVLPRCLSYPDAIVEPTSAFRPVATEAEAEAAKPEYGLIRTIA
jgi:hypothetical protein